MPQMRNRNSESFAEVLRENGGDGWGGPKVEGISKGKKNRVKRRSISIGKNSKAIDLGKTGGSKRKKSASIHPALKKNREKNSQIKGSPDRHKVPRYGRSYT